MNATGASRFRLGACFFEWRLHPPGRAPCACPIVAAARREGWFIKPYVSCRAPAQGASVAESWQRGASLQMARVPDVLGSHKLSHRWVCFSAASLTDAGSSVVVGCKPTSLSPPLASVSVCVCIYPRVHAHMLAELRHRMKQGYPLNLSISLSGGEETNQDAPSNGE